MTPASPTNPPSRSFPGFLRGDRFRRLVVLVLVAVSSAMLVVEFAQAPPRAYLQGEVADRDIRAPRAFDYVDLDETESRRRVAEETVRPVFSYDGSLGARIQSRVADAFSEARRLHADAVLAAQANDRVTLTPAELSEISREFVAILQVHLDPSDLDRAADQGWSEDLEALTVELLDVGMRGYIVADRTSLPLGETAIAVIRMIRDVDGIRQDETILQEFSQVVVPADARQRISLHALENIDADEEVVKVAVAIARSAVRPNFSYDQRETVERRREAYSGVPEVVRSVSRGTALARQGDVLTSQQVAMIAVLTNTTGRFGSARLVVALTAVFGLMCVGVFQYALGGFPRRAERSRDVESAAVLLLLTLLAARLVVGASSPLAAAIGGMPPSAFWFLAPVAGGAMLVRILINAEMALMWTLLVAVILGVMMDQNVLYTAFFVISGISSAGAVAGSRERVAVLKAGVQAGLFNAAAALLLVLVEVYLGDPSAWSDLAMRPLWSVGFAFTGGALSGVLVLGLVPLFELFGFVTDYRLLELANLNHPLLRQLMLRAPGTYHHSVTVAQLSEAAAEAIGANALQTRVACYFHDIGKAVNPKYFIENQRGGPNPHDKLPPRTSARVIINHVTDGEAIALQYKLPQPVIDGIVMHHGTGLIQYFYAMALKGAQPGQVVDEAEFRYPGRLPDTREAGIMMLADKVEAATRTLKDKSPESLRGLIQKLVNATLMDGQLERCPLTIKDLYIIIDAFTETLLGIYHHRIDYPGIPKRTDPRPVAAERPTGPVITLEIQNPLAQQHAAQVDEPAIQRPEVDVDDAPSEQPSGPIDPQTGLPFLRPERSISPDEDYESADHISIPHNWSRGRPERGSK